MANALGHSRGELLRLVLTMLLCSHVSALRAVGSRPWSPSTRHIGVSMSTAAAFGAEVISVAQGSSCYLVGAVIKRDRYKTLLNSWTIDDSLDELQRLSETAGLEVLGREYQTMQNPSPSTFVGPGKLDEIAETVRSMRVTTVIFDEELSPAQGRNVQQVLSAKSDREVKVLDRTMLILVIFAQRARTREAKLQVAAAQMKYMLPRLSTFLTEGAGLDAKGGSGGLLP